MRTRITPLVSEAQIRARVQELGAQLSKDYAGKDLVVIGLLNGVFPFFADLVRTMDLDIGVSFMQVASYGGGMESTGEVHILKDLDRSIQGRHALVVEDIVDTGLTLFKVRNLLTDREPLSLKICTLLDKPSRRKIEVPVDYIGFTIEDHFVVGYGLDLDGKLRNLPYAGVPPVTIPLPGASLLLVACLSATGCGYHRLDRQQRSAPWAKQGETIRLARFRNLTPRLGLEDRFTKALENRVVAASPWRLVAQGEPSRWVLQGTLESYVSRPIGLTLGNDKAKASAGSASRVEVAVVASVDLLDGQTGVVVLSRRGLTFSNQYRVDQNFASFDSRELQVLESLADDFAESFLTQLLEGID